MSSYRLQFLPEAKAEWDKLDGSIRQQFAKVLLRRLDYPRVPAAALTAMPDCYKIKLRSAGFRLVYQVIDDKLLLTIAVGIRHSSNVLRKGADTSYLSARQHLSD
ncbi:type II toxin-antitoxin system RelE/ParE family toxin [Rhodoferax sp.]|uniref:type II toxin-antitoxin system RelE family toxin n=1 Tax=Rhodoferax sp. TaxID=50421 RepID=UPI0025E8B0D6|nr:type II toxin-antitoxin system RelE/ParE family toxin [Rhodoferax sp.]MCM2341996.1 type II toxin-antitoxin system RelE/ParE family toxin [Rhodoferax sp.]